MRAGLDVVWRWPNGTTFTRTVLDLAPTYAGANLTAGNGWAKYNATFTYYTGEPGVYGSYVPFDGYGFAPQAPYI